MSETISNVIVPANTPVDLYLATGIDVGKQLFISMIGGGTSRFISTLTLAGKPDDASGYRSLETNSDIINEIGDPGAWIWSDSGCTVNVSEITERLSSNGGIPIDVSRPIRIEGHNSNIGGGGLWNDIWEGGALVIPEPSQAGQQVQVVSSSGDDSAAGVGVQSVRIDYLNSDDELLSEDVTLNGLTPALTIATNITDIVDLHSVTVGSNGVSVGDIDITEVGNTALIYNRIAANGNKSMSTLRHFLPSSTAYLTSLTISGDTKGTDIMLRSDSNDSGDVFPNVWLFQVPITMSDAPSTILFNPAIVIPPTARLKVSARAGASGNTVSVFINGWVRFKWYT